MLISQQRQQRQGSGNGADSGAILRDKLAKCNTTDPAILQAAACRAFGDALEMMAGELMDRVGAGIDGLGARLSGVERTAGKVFSAIQNQTRQRELAAAEATRVERAEKQLLGQWLNGFLYRLPSTSKRGLDIALDAVDFAFARYALNVAIAAPTTSEEKLILAGVPSFLVGIVRRANEAMRISDAEFENSPAAEDDRFDNWRLKNDAASLLCGPALLALTHAMHGTATGVRRAIAQADGISVLLDTLTLATQPAVLSLCCRGLAALALADESRARFASLEGLGTIANLLSKATAPGLAKDGEQPLRENSREPRVTERVQSAALQAVTNITLNSETNRRILAEVGVEPIVTSALFARDGAVVRDAAKALSNLCFRSPLGANLASSGRADEALTAALAASDLLSESEMAAAIFQALANAACDEAARTGLAAGDSMRWSVHAASQSRDPSVLRNALRAVGAAAHDHLANKMRLAELGAVEACCRVVVAFGYGPMDSTELYEGAVVAACRAATTILTYRATHLHFWDSNGLQVFASLAIDTRHMAVLAEAATVVAVMSPSAAERGQAAAEGRPLPFFRDGNDGLKALRRSLRWNYGGEEEGADEAPFWLLEAVGACALTAAELAADEERLGKIAVPSSQHELFRPELHYEEATSPVELDHIVSNSDSLHNLKLRLY